MHVNLLLTLFTRFLHQNENKGFFLYDQIPRFKSEMTIILQAQHSAVSNYHVFLDLDWEASSKQLSSMSKKKPMFKSKERAGSFF